jgi:hypothetical protein
MRLRHYRRRRCPVTIFDENITWTSGSKYLGVTLNSKLTQKTHTSCSLWKTNNRLRQLFLILNKSSTIDINLALKISKFLFRSILPWRQIDVFPKRYEHHLHIESKAIPVTGRGGTSTCFL